MVTGDLVAVTRLADEMFLTVFAFKSKSSVTSHLKYIFEGFFKYFSIYNRFFYINFFLMLLYIFPAFQGRKI